MTTPQRKYPNADHQLGKTYVRKIGGENVRFKVAEVLAANNCCEVIQTTAGGFLLNDKTQRTPPAPWKEPRYELFGSVEAVREKLLPDLNYNSPRQIFEQLGGSIDFLREV